MTEGLNDAGVHGLYAFKRIRQTNWIMGSMYPRNEAFARIDAIERAAWGGAFVLALLAGAIALGVVRRQLTPLTELHRHMLDAQAAPAEIAAPRSYRRDEIGDLSRTFDELMLQRQSSEKFLRDITDNLPAMVSHVDAQGRFTFVNARLCDRLGRSASDLVGQPAQGMHGADDSVIPERYVQRVLAGEPVTFERRASVRRGEQARFLPDRPHPGSRSIGIGSRLLRDDLRCDGAQAHRAQPRAQRGADPHHRGQHSGAGLARRRIVAIHLRQCPHPGAAQRTMRWSASRCPRFAGRRTSRSSSPTIGARSRARP